MPHAFLELLDVRTPWALQRRGWGTPSALLFHILEWLLLTYGFDKHLLLKVMQCFNRPWATPLEVLANMPLASVGKVNNKHQIESIVAQARLFPLLTVKFRNVADEPSPLEVMNLFVSMVDFIEIQTNTDIDKKKNAVPPSAPPRLRSQKYIVQENWLMPCMAQTELDEGWQTLQTLSVTSSV